jgi:fucose 4-O-acetylase-like acetyltransferase
MIKRLLALNGVSALCVVLFHSEGWGMVAMLAWADRYGAVPADQIGTFTYYVFRAIEQLIVFCIPAFLFVSGFFIAFVTGRAHKTVSWRIVGIRIRDLIIPYTIWTLVYWTLFFLEARFMDGRTFTPGEYVHMFLTGGTDPAYYYVPMLIQFLLLSPLLVYWAKVSPVSLIVVTGILQLLVQLQYYPSILGLDIPFTNFIPKWLFMTRILWFPLGIVVGFHVKPMQVWLASHKRTFLITALILYPLAIIEWELIQSFSGQIGLQHQETFLDTFFTLAVIFAFLGYYQTKLPYAHTLDDLGSKSFGIYLIHTLAMTYTARLIAVWLPGFLAYQLLFFLVMFVVGLGVPLLLMALVNRSPVRPFYKYIFG